MVILNATFNILFKSLITYSVFYDLITVILFIREYDLENVTDLLFGDFSLCHMNPLCNVIDQMGNMLYLISISIPLFFYSQFDRNFKSCKKIVFNQFVNFITKFYLQYVPD